MLNAIHEVSIFNIKKGTATKKGVCIRQPWIGLSSAQTRIAARHVWPRTGMLYQNRKTVASREKRPKLLPPRAKATAKKMASAGNPARSSPWSLLEAACGIAAKTDTMPCAETPSAERSFLAR
jgi:hypothetical protein